MALTIEALQNVASSVKIKQQLTNWKTAIDAWSATVDSKTTGLTAGGNIVVTASATAHGAGAIGTGVAPKLYSRTENGVIITQIKFDVQGLANSATADDVIGLAAGGAAYIGRYVVATYGVVYKAQLACIETPATGSADINIISDSSATKVYDNALTNTNLVCTNVGASAIGKSYESLIPVMSANDYIYLSNGTGSEAGTYTAGQYILTFWGHAALA